MSYHKKYNTKEIWDEYCAEKAAMLVDIGLEPSIYRTESIFREWATKGYSEEVDIPHAPPSELGDEKFWLLFDFINNFFDGDMMLFDNFENSRLARKVGFPLGAALTLADLENDVHAVLHRLREKEPVSWVPVINAWVVSRRDDVVAVMRDAKTYTVDHPGFSTGQVVGPSMLSLDGVEHLRHRGPFERPFRKREVYARFTQTVANAANELIDGFIENGGAELRRDYAGPIAVQVMIAALGLEKTAVSTVLGWYDAIVAAVTRVAAGEPVTPEGRAAFNALRDSLLPVLRRDPDSSLLAAAEGGVSGLSDDQIISNAAVLLFGGIETTEGMIANAFSHLFENPHILTEASTNPAILPAVVEESLRLEPAAAVVDRYATRDVILRGAHIKKDDLIQVSLAGANRDPAVFTNPDRFDPHRSNLRSHVTFAQGPHVCLGIHLARLEAHDALALALQRLPSLRLVNPKRAKPTGLIFRKPEALDVQWSIQS
ncbi:MAG: cytochrome P450 [Chloroflexota bacterium]